VKINPATEILFLYVGVHENASDITLNALIPQILGDLTPRPSAGTLPPAHLPLWPFLLPFPLEVGPLNPARGSGGALKSNLVHFSFKLCFSGNCTNQRNHNQNGGLFLVSRPWQRAYFLDGPNAAASIAPTLIQHCLLA